MTDEPIRTLSHQEVLQTIIELDEVTGEVSDETLLRVLKYPEQIVPAIIQKMEATCELLEKPFETYEEDVGNACFNALFLLTELGDQRAFDVVMRAARLRREGPFTLFGDAVTEILSLTFARLCGERVDALEELISDEKVNEYVRWAAASSLKYLVLDGRLTIDQAKEKLFVRLDQYVKLPDPDLATFLVSELMGYPFEEMPELVKQAFEDDLVDPRHTDEEEWLSEAQEVFRDPRAFEKELILPTNFDAVEQLAKWKEMSSRETASDDSDFFDDDLQDDENVFDPDYREPIRNEHRKVGRNEPCPCGSGKKYKKCCGRA